MLKESRVIHGLMLDRVLEDQLVSGIVQEDLDLFAEARRIANPVSYSNLSYQSQLATLAFLHLLIIPLDRFLNSFSSVL